MKREKRSGRRNLFRRFLYLFPGFSGEIFFEFQGLLFFQQVRRMAGFGQHKQQNWHEICFSSLLQAKDVIRTSGGTRPSVRKVSCK
ncbi:hypothetical protein AALB19_04010 [Oscillospiraceae bacterium 50-58]